jgi:hypothetical protein
VQAYLFPQWSNLSTEISHRRSFESPAVHQMCLVTTYNKFESAVKHHKSRQPNYNKFTNGKCSSKFLVRSMTCCSIFWFPMLCYLVAFVL